MKNVVLFTIDTLRKDVLGCYGNTVDTPFIDSIQEKCIRFTNLQAIGPYTQASFPGILTSSYYLEYGKQKMLSTKRTLISEVLKKAGITTAAFHSNPYLSEYFGWNRSWDIFYDSMEEDVTDEVPYVKGDVINRNADNWLSTYTENRDYNRFFLWTHYMDVHEPYVPEKKYVDMIDPAIILDRAEMFGLFKDPLLKRDVSDKGKVELLKKLYRAHVREVDGYVEEFFAMLKKYDLLQNTVVIMTADHGDEFGEHNGLSHDGKMYSENINVPFLIYDYTRDKEEECDTLMSNIDIPPTILHLFGLDAIDNFRGISALPYAEYPEKGCFGEAIGKKSAHEKETDKPVYYYQEKNLKIIYSEEGDKWELYDLSADPEELDNIIDTSSEKREMKDKLQAAIDSIK